jgi:hypothetical protein
LKIHQQLWTAILRDESSDAIGVHFINSMMRISSAAQEVINVNSSLPEDGSQCSFRHVPRMIGDGGITIAGFAIPDFMGACRLSIKHKAKATQLPGDFAIAKT